MGGAAYICINVNNNVYGDGCDVKIATTKLWFEAECGTVGSLWDISSSSSASNEKFVSVKSGNNSTGNAPESNGQISYIFNVEDTGNYMAWAKLITPSDVDDSFWLRMDNGDWDVWNDIGPYTSWTWEKCKIYKLFPGSHTLTFAYREDGAKLDKIHLTNTLDTPTGLGDSAATCITDTNSQLPSKISQLPSKDINIYPNPAENLLTIDFVEEIDNNVELQVYTPSGLLVKNKRITRSSNVVDISELSSGLYIIQFTINNRLIRSNFIKK